MAPIGTPFVSMVIEGIIKGKLGHQVWPGVGPGMARDLNGFLTRGWE